MNKTLFLMSAALAIAVPARSQVGMRIGAMTEVSFHGPTGQAWVSPLAGVFSSVGADRIALEGSPALTALATLDPNAGYPFAADARVLDLLAENLKFYATPKSFAALPMEDKLIALRAAAKDAESEAARIAGLAIAEVKSRSLHPSSADALSKRVAEAEDVALYLDAPLRKELSQMRSKVESFQSKWRQHVKKFNRELPSKIAAGAFDASNILVKTEHGWVAADESPYPIENLSEFYIRRAEALQQSPEGPWTVKEAAYLADSLLRPEVAKDSVFPEYEALKFRVIAKAAETSMLANKSLVLARAAFQKNAQDGSSVAPRHIMAVDKHYDGIVMNSSLSPTSIRLRILASIRNGADGLPSWRRLRELEISADKRLRRNALIAAGALAAGFFVTLLISGSVGIPAWPLSAQLAAFALTWLTPLLVFVRNLWQAESMTDLGRLSFVGRILDRTFPKD